MKRGVYIETSCWRGVVPIEAETEEELLVKGEEIRRRIEEDCRVMREDPYNV